MKKESKIKIAVNDLIIGGNRPLFCIPVVSTHSTYLEEDLNQAVSQAADIIEWRADYLDNINECGKIIDIFKNSAGKTTLIFTFRKKEEGGKSSFSGSERVKIINEYLNSGIFDFIDVEISAEEEEINDIMETARENGVKIIFSYHNFHSTPSSEEIVKKLLEAEEKGGSIAKIAVMPRNAEDVMTLLYASNEARKRLEIPMISISMGELGKISRIAGAMFSSDIIFVSVGEKSAPGQIHIEKAREIFSEVFSGEIL